VKRRLAVILAADMVGYTRLMATNQAGTIELVRSLRETLFEPKIAAEGGQVLKRMGDGWLVSFDSVGAAVDAAMAAQTALAGHPSIALRIALHLGEIVEGEDDIYGAGINIASRLQADAPPGGLIVSLDLHRQLDEAVGDRFTRIGPLALKNVKEPMTAFLWRPDAPRKKAEPSVPVIAVEQLTTPAGEIRYAEAGEEVRDRLIADLSRRTGVRAVAAGIGPNEGATYAIRGRLVKRGTEARLSLSLISSVDGSAIWSDTWIGEEDDLPDLCDVAVEAANAELRLAINALDANRFSAVSDDRLGPSELRSRAANQIYAATFESMRHAQHLIKRALELDPDNGMSLAMKCEVDMYLTITQLALPGEDFCERLEADTDRAVEALPSSDYAAYVRALARVYVLNDLAGARRELQRLRRVNPGYHLSHEIEGLLLIAEGSYVRGAKSLADCNARSMRDPYIPQRLYAMSVALLLGGDARGASGAIAEAIELRPSCRLYRLLLAEAEEAAGQPGAAAKAHQAAARIEARTDLMAPRLRLPVEAEGLMDRLFAKVAI
jgi:class 3 adenylate cyclase